MDLIRTLNSVGKSTFVKYYYNFKNQSRDECILRFDENFTDKAKSTRTEIVVEGFYQLLPVFLSGRVKNFNFLYGKDMPEMGMITDKRLRH